MKNKIAVFGVGGIFKKYYGLFKEEEIVCLIDNDESLWGKLICTHQVFPPSYLSEIEFDYVIIATGINTGYTIYNQLLSLNISKEKIYFMHEYSSLKNDYANIRKNEKKNNDLISIIIPTYNRSHCIKKSVLSVLAQSHSNLEVIIVDDGSTDNTEEIISSIIDSRIHYVKLKHNSGPSVARNEGIRVAKGNLIAFQDSDDIWHANKLSEQYETYLKHQDGIMFFCSFGVFEDEANKILYSTPSDPHLIEQINNNPLLFPHLIQGNFIGTPTMIIKKEFFEKNGGFDESLNTHEDWELALRVASLGKIYFTNKILVDVYLSKNSVNALNTGEKVFSLFKILLRYYNYSSENSLYESFIKIILGKLQLLEEEEKNRFINFVFNMNIDKDLIKKLFLFSLSECYKKNDYINNLINQNTYLNSKNNLIKFKKDYFSELAKIGDGKINIKGIPPQICIYGIGEVGISFFSFVKKNKIKVTFFIDRKPKTIDDIPCYTMDAIPSGNIPIVVTSYDPMHNIAKDLRKYTSAAIYFLDDFFRGLK